MDAVPSNVAEYRAWCVSLEACQEAIDYIDAWTLETGSDNLMLLFDEWLTDTTELSWAVWNAQKFSEAYSGNIPGNIASWLLDTLGQKAIDSNSCGSIWEIYKALEASMPVGWRNKFRERLLDICGSLPAGLRSAEAGS